MTLVAGEKLIRSIQYPYVSVRDVQFCAPLTYHTTPLPTNIFHYANFQIDVPPSASGFFFSLHIEKG